MLETRIEALDIELGLLRLVSVPSRDAFVQVLDRAPVGGSAPGRRAWL